MSRNLAWSAVGVVAVLSCGWLIGCSAQQVSSRDEVVRQAAPSAGARRWSFDHDPTGAPPPPGWSIRQTRPTKAPATWQVVADPAAPSRPNILSLTRTENEDGTFNLAIIDGTSYRDLDLSVKLRANTGKEDQGGGPIWRCRDENNYYICRLNPLESNFRVYKVVEGKRTQLDSVKVESQAGRWYTIRVVMSGGRITCALDGKEMLHATDETFAEAGVIGLWTKADAASSFDDVMVK